MSGYRYLTESEWYENLHQTLSAKDKEIAESRNMLDYQEELIAKLQSELSVKDDVIKRLKKKMVTLMNPNWAIKASKVRRKSLRSYTK